MMLESTLYFLTPNTTARDIIDSQPKNKYLCFDRAITKFNDPLNCLYLYRQRGLNWQTAPLLRIDAVSMALDWLAAIELNRTVLENQQQYDIPLLVLRHPDLVDSIARLQNLY